MADSKTMKSLTKLINKIPYLKQLNHDNQQYLLWRSEVFDTLEILFGKDSTEYQRFALAAYSWNPFDSEAEKQQRYIRELDSDETKLKSIIQRQKIKKTSLKTEEKPPLGFKPPYKEKDV